MEFVRNPVQRQTQSYLRELLSQHRLRPKNKLGQNFLIDLNLLEVIVQAAELSRADLVLEIGTGTGSLTQRMAAHAGTVLSVEIDASFYRLASEVLMGLPHVHLMQADVLKSKNTLNPGVLAKLRELCETSKVDGFKLVANLPYAVATPVISNLLLADLPVERMVVMVQWEIAERLTAEPGTKDYGALGILVQSLADVEIIRRLSPTVFWPRPKVDSGIVRIVPSRAKRSQIPNVLRFRHFLRDLYAHRRKNLRGALVSMHGRDHDKAAVDATLAQLGIPGTVRAETLSIAHHLQLCQAFDGLVHDESDPQPRD